MSFAPIAYTIPQYEDFPNWWMKAFEQGTTTPKMMASDSIGSSQVAKYELNSNGFPITAGNAKVIPNIDGVYDLWLFPTEADADANDTSNAIQLADNIISPPPVGDGAISVNELTTAAMTANTNKSYAVGDVVITAEFSTGNGGGATYKVVLTSSVTPNEANIIVGVADALISFVLKTSTILIAAKFGSNASLADNKAIWQIMGALKPSEIRAPSGDLVFLSGLVFGTSFFIVGEGGGTASGSETTRTNLIHDFVGTFITMDGSDVTSNSGAGGGIRKANIIQRDTTGAVVDTAVLLTGSTVNDRVGWFRISESNIEHESGADQWLNSVDFDGSVVGGVNGIRDFWFDNGRVVGDVRINNAFNVFMTAIEGNLGSNIEILGDSASIHLNGCNFANINIDDATGVYVNGGAYTSWSTTANSTNVVMMPQFISFSPSTPLLGAQIYAQYFDDGTNGYHFFSNQDNGFTFSRDVNAGDSTSIIQSIVGNAGSNQGRIATRYNNAAATGGPLAGIFFDPRNNADSTTFSGGKLTWSKVPGTDTTQAIWEATGGKITIHQSGVIQPSIPIQQPTFTVATLPSAAASGQVIYVSDEAGGAVLAFSSGGSWLRCTDRTVVS